MRRPLLLLALLVAAGCALYSDVVVSPLIYDPTNIDRGSDFASMTRKSDINRAVALAADYDAKAKKSAQDLGALGEAELIAGRYDDARRHLREAIDLQPFRTVYAQIAWDLSQLEYMSNNFEASFEWARSAIEHGVNVRPWHVAYLEALSNINVYKFNNVTTERLPFKMGHPDVPRIEVTVNGHKNASAIIDSGAVLSIVSESLADSVPVRRLGDIEGQFAGLLLEPIPVRFGIIDRLELGRMSIENVPVAVMPDDKMKFLVSGKREFKIDFLLGAHLLKEFRIELDFRRNGVTLTRILQSARKPVADQNLFIMQFRPAVRGTINRHGWYLFILDTGSEVTFLNERQLGAMPIQIFAPKMHNATLQGLGGAKKHGEELENVEIGVDRWAGTYHTIPMYDAGENERTTGIIGENYLKKFDVVIDFGRMRVDIEPTGIAALVSRPEEGVPEEKGRVPP